MRKLQNVLVVALFALGVAACGDDDDDGNDGFSPDDGGGGDDGGDDGDDDGSATGDDSGATGDDSGATGDDGGATGDDGGATGDDGGATGDDGGATGDDGGADTGDGGNEENSGYGPCGMPYGCHPDELCVGLDQTGGSFCGYPCVAGGADTCPPAPEGTAQPACVLATQDPPGEWCALTCDAPGGGQANCPTGMSCDPLQGADYGVCTWPA